MVMAFFGGLITFFGKDYLINAGRIVFILSFVGFLVLLAVLFLRLQTRFQNAATELRRTQEEEYFERVKLLTLMNTLKDAVIILDASGYVTAYNAATLDLFNTNIDIVRHPASNVFKPARPEDFDLEKILQDLTGSREFEFTNITKSGERVPLDVFISRARTGYGKIGSRSFVVVAKKVTSDKAAKESIKLNNAGFKEGIDNAILMLEKGRVEQAEHVLGMLAKRF